MHFIVLVIGPDVAGQLAPHEGSHWDRWQIGGRYSGGLLLKPGATGEFGDQRRPRAESALAKIVEEAGGHLETGGPLPIDGDRADVARKGDVAHVIYPFAIVREGSWQESWDYQTLRTIEQLRSKGFDVDCPKKEGDRAAAWKDDFDDIIESLPPDTLLTVVDCHN